MNSLINHHALVSIFVPVYNGENYLEETLNSIKKQTYKNIEVLVVDDSSTDSSLSILNNFAKEDSRFKVFVKENGGTVPHSMNYIIPEINGEFFFYSSQDDLFSIDLIEKMVERQLETKADCVLPDMEFYFENQNSNKQLIGLNGNRKVELNGKEAFIASLDWTIHGFALFKSSAVKAEYFPEDAFDSDEFITRKLFLQSNKVVFSEGSFFYRQDNSKAITKSFSKKNFYVLNTDWRLYTLIQENDFEPKIIFKIQSDIIHRYLNLYSTYENFEFKSENDKNEVGQFLKDFKKKKLNNSFLFNNFQYLVIKFKLKQVLLISILKSEFLFNLVIKYKLKKASGNVKIDLSS